MPHRDAALTLVAVSPVSPGPEGALRAVLDRLGPSVFAGLLDSEGMLRYANHAALRAIGSTPEQVLGLRFDETPWWLICEQSRQRLQQALASASCGEASRFDVRVTTRGGAMLTMDFSLLPLYGPDGRVVWLVPSACDVSEREKAEHQLLLTRHAVEQANDALFQVGPDGAFRDANAAACRLLGLEREHLLRLRVPDIDTQMDGTQWPKRWRDMCERGSLRFETNIRHHDGHEIPADVSVSLVTGDDVTFAHVCINDLRERRAAEHLIQQLLHFDELTGLPNRQRLFDRLDSTLQSSDHTGVLVLELDRFKRINDGLGLHIGDAALREVAQRIVATVRSVDLVARHGGDEFVIVIPAPVVVALHTAQALLDAVARPMTIEGHEIHMTCSIGIAMAPGDSDRADTLLRRANAALHQARLQGRNQVSVYAGAPHDDDRERLTLEAALRRALRMAVNLSARQLLRPDLARRIEGLLAAAGLDPRLFGVEVTECMLIANFDEAVRQLRALRAIGVEISLDDFGTGYSSLSYLRRLPVDVVKIDRSLVPDVTSPADDVSITRAIITMAHSLQMKVLAEGVESEAQAALLAANQCDQMQGYWFSAALPAAKVEAMLRNGRQIDPAVLDRRSRQRSLPLGDDEQVRDHLPKAFAMKEMADQHRHLDQEAQTANRELTELNRRLQTLLDAQREKNDLEAASLEAAQELLDAVRVPVFAIDEEGILMFANAPAQAMGGLGDNLLGGRKVEQLTQILRGTLEGHPMQITLAGRRWWAMSRQLSGDAHGRALVLLPQDAASN
jgi:diguanylate cyclase (GGDEF)-like protein/PAS domain S-box-containing protein